MQATQLPTITDSDRLAGKYLTFLLAAESYGLEILKVREIIGLMDITSVPRTPEHTRGVINLRGKIIPVIDLRLKFGMNRIEDTEQTCIIVVDVETDDQACQVGVLVDGVSEVLDIDSESIEPAPSFGADVDASFIRGMAKANDSVAILLNVENVLSAPDVIQIAEAASNGQASNQTTSNGESE